MNDCKTLPVSAKINRTYGNYLILGYTHIKVNLIYSYKLGHHMGETFFIVGAGGQAIETFSIFEANGLSNNILGFLEENSKRIGMRIFGKPINDLKYLFNENNFLTSKSVCAIGTTRRKRLIIELKSKGVEFINVIHPSSIISPHSEIERGSIIAPLAVINAMVTIRSHVIINYCSSIGHGSIIGAYSTISPGVRISGNVKLREQIFIGNNASISEGLNIGNGAIIGAGTVVTDDVPDLALVVGVPGKIKKIYDNLEERPW